MALDNLIFNRTQSDVNRVQSLTQKMIAGTATEAEREEWLGGMKGAYNAADLNRVSAAMAYLVALLESLGYSVPGYSPVSIDHPQPSRLPDGYTELEYIESTGTQYINTGVLVNQDSGVLIRCEFSPQTSAAWLFGARQGTYVNTFNFLTVNGLYRSDYGNGEGGTPFSIPSGPEFTLSKMGAITEVGGEVEDTAQAQTFSSSIPLYLFANNNNGAVQGQASAKLYYVEILNGATVIRDFVPCVDREGAVGLYDVKNEGFYQNSGTGNFIAGPETAPEQSFDQYTCYENDIPTLAQMEQYLANVATLRDRLPYVAPDAPANMTGLTYQEANNIEEILYTLERVLLAMQENFKLRQANTFFMTAGGVFNNA